MALVQSVRTLTSGTGRGVGDSDRLGRGLAATVTEQRTVPVISRAASLNTLLGAHPDVASATVAGLRGDLVEFCSAPATSPSELEQSPTD